MKHIFKLTFLLLVSFLTFGQLSENDSNIDEKIQNFIEKGQLSEAEKICLTILNLSERDTLPIRKQKLLAFLSEIYAKKSDYQQSYDYLDLHLSLRDSLQDVEKQQINNGLSKKYQVANKEYLLIKKELALAKQKNTTQWWLLSTLIAFVLAILSGILIFYNRVQHERKLNASFDLISRKIQGFRQQIGKNNLSLPPIRDQYNPQIHNIIEQIGVFETDILGKIKNSASFNHLISHEIQRDLELVETNLGGLEKSLKDIEKVALQGCKKRISKLGDLVKELLNLSELEQKAIQNTVFSLSDLVAEVKNDLAIPDNCQIINQDLPLIEGDRLLMKHVFINLLSNSLKYSLHKPHILIKVFAEIDDDLKIKVVDNGLGFEASLSHHLFQPFQRLHSHIAGTGVGLMVVKNIIEKHGGQVFSYNNHKSEGATFGFSLPISLLK